MTELHLCDFEKIERGDSYPMVDSYGIFQAYTVTVRYRQSEVECQCYRHPKVKYGVMFKADTEDEVHEVIAKLQATYPNKKFESKIERREEFKVLTSA
jgi:hypothetical protein